MLYALIFIFGSVIGSFLNVCIYRMPRNESIIRPRSRCVSCKKSLLWYHNIPLFSYIFLRGKCAFCGNKISFRYFAVELLSAVCFSLSYMNFGFTYKFWIYSILVFSLIVITFIDLEFQVIPDVISLGGLVLGIALSALMPGLHIASNWKQGLLSAFSGAVVGAGLIYFIGLLGNAMFKKESMGFGDVKLMAMLGAFLGWKLIILVFFLAPFFGTLPGIYLKFCKKHDTIPYGPYISLASFVVILWGNNILSYLFLR